MNRVQVMNFLVTNRVAVPVNIILVPVLLFRAYPSVLGEVICHPTNERICCSRWWERHVATLRVSGTRMVAVRSDRHPTLRNIWPPKPSTPSTRPGAATTATAAGWTQCSSTSSCWLSRFLGNSAPSVQQDRRTTGCGCLDSHN